MNTVEATSRSATQVGGRKFARRRGTIAARLLAGAAIAAAWSAQALAADAPPSGGAAADAAGSSTTLPEVVVTAQKRRENVNTVPMSITAVTGTQLANEGVTQPRDLTKVVPGFVYADSDTGTPIYTLRGIGFTDYSLGGRSTVSVSMDEAPIPFSIETRGASFDLERVEVLKGPQGTLFGQNTTGGAINYIAAKPTKSFDAGLDASYGSYNATDLGGFISGPLSDTLTARLAVDHQGGDGWQTSYSNGSHLGAVDFTNARLLLAWTPTDKLKVQLNVNGYYDHSEMQAPQLIGIHPAAPPATAALVPNLLTAPLAPHNDTAADWVPGQDYHRHNNFFQTNLRADYELPGNLVLTSLTSYSHFYINQLIPESGTLFPDFQYSTRGQIDSASQELRLAGDFLQHGHFVVGANFAYDAINEVGHADVSDSTYTYLFVGLGPNLPLFKDFSNISNQVEHTYAVFGNVDYNLTDTIKIYGGARFTQTDDHYDGCSADSGDDNASTLFTALANIVRGGEELPPIPTMAPGACNTFGPNDVPTHVYNRLDENNVSWRVGANWTPFARTLIYANVSKGYKAGSFPILGSSATPQLNPARQESVQAYEVGFKTTLVDRTLQLNGAAFYYDYNDKQILGTVLDPIFGSLLELINVPKSSITGAEAQLVWSPIRGLTLSGGGSYIDSRIEGHYTSQDQFGTPTDFNNEAFPNAPRWQATGDVDYRWSLNDKVDGFVGGNVAYQSATNSLLGNLPVFAVNARALVDLRAGVQSTDGAWKLTVWGHNVGNVYYWNAAAYTADVLTRYTGMPATWGATLNYRFH